MTGAAGAEQTAPRELSGADAGAVDRCWSVSASEVPLAAVSRASGTLAAAIAGVALFGWAFDLPALQSVLPGSISMKINTALAFLVTGLALASLAKSPARPRPAIAAVGAGVGLLGLVNALEYLVPALAALPLDELFLRDRHVVAPWDVPGRMAHTTALAMSLLGIALVLEGRGGVLWLRRCLALAIAGIACLGLVGHAYGAESLLAIGGSRMALNTAAAFLLAAISLAACLPADPLALALLSKPGAGWDLSRRLLPAAALLPFLLGFALLEGQRSGYYDPTIGLALMMVAMVAALVSTIGWTAVVANRWQRTSSIAQERFVATFEQAAVGIAHVAPDGRWLRVNRKLCEIVGYERDELLVRTFQDLTHPDDLPADLDQANRVLAGELDTFGMEKRYFRKDGTIVWINLTVSLVRTPAGAPDYFISVIEDISLRKAAELSCRRLEESLRQSQKMEVVGRLAGGIAHDFNNLLTPILGYCELVRLRLPASEARSREEVGEIAKCGERAADLTRRLLAFSRRQVLQPRNLDLNAVVAGVGKLLQRVIGEDVRLEFRPAPGLGTVRLDAGQLEQVLMNLAVNARDAMPAGGVLTIATANVTLDRAAVAPADVAPGAYVLLAIGDTGVGMGPEVLSHVFEPFFTTKDVGKGTGLGLATVHGVVKQSGGHIAVASEPGRGTTFRIYFPRVDASPGEAIRTPAAVPARGGDETILVVEDDPAVRQLAVRILRKAGYTVLEAADGVCAVSLADRHPGTIDLLLTDVVMPNLGGREAAARIRAKRPGIAVLYVSGYATDAIGPGGFEPGTHFLEKPFVPARLTERIREALDARP